MIGEKYLCFEMINVGENFLIKQNRTLMNQETESYDPGEQLPVEINYLWLIVEGVVKSYTINQEGKTIILGFWGKQEVVGKSLSSVSPYFIQ